ncbi:hypothetical protein [Terrarubrum flagellatum]|uniref:hypothetical protein n=1 Tax=Terrirubrum flagellatum TaxID=2895980 RepID=UPI003144F93B
MPLIILYGDLPITFRRGIDCLMFDASDRVELERWQKDKPREVAFEASAPLMAIRIANKPLLVS